MVGRTLAGRYEVLELIGSGGMSVVFRGLDHTLGREVAVKVVSLAPASDEILATLRERFRREAASAARIQHPNVVGIFDYGTDAELELDFIVMELLRGRDLKDALAGGPLPHPEAVRILMDAARGVAAGHRAGILHRDVKPANVFLVGDRDNVEAVRILDFGIAKALEEDPEQRALTTIGHLPHSPAYAAPEQLDASAAISPASDVYQLGLIGYEMLAGRRAYTEDERARIRGGAEVPLPRTEAWATVPAGICSVIHRALRPKAKERYADAAAFAEALARAQEHDATVLNVAPLAVAPDADTTQLAESVPVAAAPVPVTEPVAVVVDPVPAASTPRVPPPIALEPSISGVPVSRPGTAFNVRKSPAVWVVPVLLLLAVVVWAARRGGGEPEAAIATTTAAEADTGRLAQMDGDFLKLEGQAAAAAPATPAPSVPGAGPATAGGAPVSPAIAVPAATVPTGADVLARAKVEIEAGVRDLNQAWVDGELQRHVSHYGSRVDYYNSRRLPRASVLRDRRRDLRKYEQRQITLRGIQVQFVEPDRARVLVDKEWVFGGDSGVRQGRGTQEYVMKRDEDDGKWYVVSEQLLTTNEARVPASR